MQIRQALITFRESFLDFLYPPSCFYCDAFMDKHRLLCDECRDSIEPIDLAECAVCNHDIPKGEKHCIEHKTQTLDEPIIFFRAYAKFNDIVRSLIHALKYNGRDDIGIYFGRKIGEMVLREEIFNDYDLCIAVPLYSTRKRERGYNQSAKIAKGISEVSGIPFFEKIAKRTKATKSQTTMNIQERIQNVANIFKIEYPEMVKNKNIIITDDVITTGSTVKSLSRALLESGAGKICAVSISRPVDNQGNSN
ncbi:MAG: ComF family protein [Candidatus Zixiibacteriota bacterium]